MTLQAVDPGDTTGAWDGIQGVRRDLLGTLDPARDPARVFLQLGLSERTTYDAVTHALEKTQLTGENGQPMGTVLDLIERVERVAGERKGASLDQQFRLFCTLKPGARQVIANSREFYRGFNNCIFHRGYPLSYRQGGGSPKIQVSMSRDGARADIDIDYKMPLPLIEWFNGHLSASNSDVRAGNNHKRHNRRWLGLFAWWRGLFKMQIQDRSPAPDAPVAGGSATGAPAGLSESAQEFLTHWLVRGNWKDAAEFVTPGAKGCAWNESTAAPPLAELLRAARPGYSLPERIAAVTPWDPEFATLPHNHSSHFSVVRVPKHRAGAMTCDGPAEQDRYQTMFRFLVDGEDAGSVALTWQKDGRRWKVASYRVIEG